ncbi:MAG: endo alpha-1,4 polygalactosaminidase [Candidatus Eisenbacteria bacterium]|nr:endo alpha-1,4 polygalactosaminidase [Candidatus Eisenbacteria bacterium]
MAPPIASASHPIQITDHPARDWEPTFSPSGTSIAFQSDRDGNWEIYRVELTSGVVSRLTDDPCDDWQPNWSPHGDRIAFQSNHTGNWEIYSMAADGSDLHRITDDPGEDTDPSWSADQTMILFASDRGGQEESDIWVLRAGYAAPLQVTWDLSYDGAPSFSPDGTWIAFESSRGGDLDLWRIDSPYAPVSWNTIDDFVYQLQDVSLDAIGATRFDLVIMDYSADGSDETRFTAAQIAGLKASPGGAKLVLAYMSIGEAEDYRWYWQESWDADRDGTPDPCAPSWLGDSNPDWQGNYKVRYWDPAWQALICGTSDSYLRRVVGSGFDGVYLDIIDAYEYWGPGGESGEDRASAEEEMAEFVIAIARSARAALGRPGFGIFPQNGEELSRHADYVDAVTGIGREDTWYDGNTPQAPSLTSGVLWHLDEFARANKVVLVTDYVTEPLLVDDFYARALARGFVPYATVRDLDRLVVNAGHEPD